MAEKLVSWDKSYYLGIHEIDKQHKALVILVNKVWFSIINKADKKTTFALIAELQAYTITHFAKEESLMLDLKYPEYQQHRQTHQHFIDRVNTEKENALREGRLSLDILYFLRDWLVEHIKGSDRAFAQYARQAYKRKHSFFRRLISKIFG